MKAKWSRNISMKVRYTITLRPSGTLGDDPDLAPRHEIVEEIVDVPDDWTEAQREEAFENWISNHIDSGSERLTG